jgi:hypothetical protein
MGGYASACEGGTGLPIGVVENICVKLAGSGARDAAG